MCLCVFSYRQHPDFELILVSNRDEYLNRPTAEAHWWKEDADLLAGKDLKEGGIWLGIKKNGKFALLTNYRDLRNYKAVAPSRGKIPLDFLSSGLDSSTFIRNFKDAQNFNGFSILLFDIRNLCYFNNIKKDFRIIDEGLYGLSNAFLDTPWYKVEKKKTELKELIKYEFEMEDLFQLFSDKTESPDELLPDTGLDYEMEKKISPAFIVTPEYGTVNTTVILIDYSGNVVFAERNYNTSEKIPITKQFEFTVKK